VKDKSSSSLLQVISSVSAAMFGVQSDKNRERDFNAANPKTYIIVGIVFTILFVLSIIGVVTIVTG
jgi:hypothetical protein